ncbi:septation protein IspZ [Escherichia coli]
MPQPVWSKLNLAWAVFFILCGLANIYIAFWLPQNIWVNFKVFRPDRPYLNLHIVKRYLYLPPHAAGR